MFIIMYGNVQLMVPKMPQINNKISLISNFMILLKFISTISVVPYHIKYKRIKH